MVERRTFLKVGGVAGVGAAVGVGSQVFPIRPHLHDVRLFNYRSDEVSLDIRLDADGETAFRSTVEVPSEELLHLPCDWPRVAWGYEIAVRPTDRSDWQTRSWGEGGTLCKKIVINEEDEYLDPISFLESSECPRRFEPGSCA